MGKRHLFRTVLIIVTLIAAVFALYPTLRYYGLAGVPSESYRERAIKLGLDLLGGMHLVLEVDTSKLTPEEAKDAGRRAHEVIANRIDQFGVAEPVIQQQGDNRIIVELPGIKDVDRAVNLIGQTALLEFRMLKEAEAFRSLLNRIDERLAARQKAPTDLTGGEDRSHPLTSLLTEYGSDIVTPAENADRVRAILADPEVQDLILAEDGMVLWAAHPDDVQGQKILPIYYVKRRPEMTGEVIADARAQRGQSFTHANQPLVNFRTTAEGTRIFGRVTGANVGRRMAIVLDGKVASAPTIQSKIDRGTGEVTGSRTMEEAQDLAIVLRAGALPAPINIISKQVVGPSLGADSIRMGTRASLVALLVVAIFMVLYYRLSGLVADVALFLNMVFLLAVMAYLQATLTLPGIAGIVLTIGMAVDANILIFERVKEELRAGKTVKAAIEIGYEKAFRTILDSNVTTLITAVALYEFGTGPIRGFAVTLIVGIIASMFTAITVTRAIFDFATDRWRPQQLSIGTTDPFKDANFGFIKVRRLAFVISGALTAVSLLTIAVQGGMKSGIDFQGGTLLEAYFDPAVPVGQVRGALGAVAFQGKTLNLSDSEIKSVENDPKRILIRVASAGGEEGVSDAVKTHLRQTFPNNLGSDWVRQEVNVGPKIGRELMWNATKAVLWSMVGILVYIAFRFEFKFGVGAILALFHDVTMTLGFLSVIGEEMSMAMVAALLTLLGYSNNDTIVVYDRIREGLRSFRRGQKYEEVVNRSINETLNRSIVTHATVLLVVLILLFFGGEVNRSFSLALTFGVLVGIYSSIYIASPIVVEWYLRRNAAAANGKGASREAAVRRA
ncbi:MAG: hypothetical protein A3F84_03570 [Candidatus Handelsmanbacteria bacterium RIFCSPLOWO2_12_FULL_64_10]|uniref:Multifunctional fusion protein n=1 Tax=Handelsmanbacteria sp. (strain RIFCSPLOWO2_12_FULL_64_10) TaxID=1817868 RepID=A0A1F6CCE6_HANXR|nr:MAG: hypothetical protein A3F84_03570 [Candidatus Handelsmanbacteria bacterium RIFCSPLOWO2_12_FULL_64_10]